MIEAADDTLLIALARTVVERFAPERIMLFGSRARGDHHSDSDYDLMVVLDEPPHRADAVYRAILDIHTNVDVIVETSERFERRRTDVGTLAYAADREGRLLYRRGAAEEPRRVRERPDSPPDSLREWIARADDDFAAMADLGESRRSNPRGTIVFHAHQGIEKMLKAALIARGVQPPRTHELPVLLQRSASQLRDDPVLLEACAGLQALWPASRYPDGPVPTAEQVRQAVRWAERARERVGDAIRG